MSDSKVLKPNTLTVLNSRYFLKDSQGDVQENWESLCRRVADFVATGEIVAWEETVGRSRIPQEQPTREMEDRVREKSEELANQFYTLLWDRKFSPNSPTWFNAGTKYPMLSACFILPVEDSIRGIFKAVQDGAVIFKYGGGIGMDFSALRSNGSRTAMGGIASGPLSFMQAFQTMSDTMTQGGRRRGAMMAMLDVHHPEILQFIDCKLKTLIERAEWLKDTYGLEDGTAESILENLEWRPPYNGFNISVKLTDEFMKAVETDSVYPLRNCDGTPFIGPISDPRNEFTGTAVNLPARAVWNRIVEGAHQSAEPGICFIDRINQDNPVKSLGDIRNSNPCGEYFQVPYNSCNLGSINLSKFFCHKIDQELKWFEKIDWVELSRVARLSTRFLDHVITLNRYPLEEISQVTRASRPVGLGVMGFADLLLSLGVRYGSSESVEVAGRIMQFIQYEAWRESVRMAMEFGSFPELKNNKLYFDEKMLRLHRDYLRCPIFPTLADYSHLDEQYEMYGVRNCHVTVIAPTGTISLIAECSSGIEPIFAYKMLRKDSVGSRDYTHPFLEQWEREHPDMHMPGFAVDASQVKPLEHVAIQEAFQKYTCNAVSKTCNMPGGSTVEDVEEIYLEAWKRGLKGVTVYVDGSREGVLHREDQKPVVTSLEEAPTDKIFESDQVKSDWHRPTYLPGGTWKVEIPKGNLYVTANWDSKLHKVIEVFMRENSGNEHVELNGRLISLLLRTNLPLQQILKQLRRTRGEQSIWYDGQCYTSVAQVVAHIMEIADRFFRSVDRSVLLLEDDDLEPAHNPPDLVLEDSSVATESVNRVGSSGTCPECGSGLVPGEGCHKCLNCGFSTCGGTGK